DSASAASPRSSSARETKGRPPRRLASARLVSTSARERVASRDRSVSASSSASSASAKPPPDVSRPPASQSSCARRSESSPVSNAQPLPSGKRRAPSNPTGGTDQQRDCGLIARRGRRRDVVGKLGGRRVAFRQRARRPCVGGHSRPAWHPVVDSPSHYRVPE